MDLTNLVNSLGTPAIALVAVAALGAVVALWRQWAIHSRDCAAIQARMEQKLDRVLERLGEGGDRFADHENRLRALEHASHRRE